MVPPFSYVLDTPQTRIKAGYDQLLTQVCGNDWSKRFRERCYIDPINGVAMLRPYPLKPEWDKQFTGNYARYRLSDYRFTRGSSKDWFEVAPQNKADGFIKYAVDPGGSFNPIAIAPAQPRNGSMVLAWYASNVSSERFVQMQCGWGPNAGYTTDPLALRFWSDGTVEVWQSGQLSGTYDFTGSAGQTYTDGTSDGFPSSTAQQWIYVVMMPYRTRELLVIGNKGGGFTHTFESIDPSDEDPTIIPAGNFWWGMLEGMAQGACAPCKFETSGYAVGYKTFWPKAPQSGRELRTHVYGQTHGGSGQVSLCQPDNPEAVWTSNDSDTVCRLKVALQGNGITTPNISGLVGYYPTETVQSFAGNRVLDDYVTKASISVSDSCTDNRVSFEIREPQYVNDNVAPRIMYNANRAFTLRLGGVSVLTGATEGTKFVEGLDDVTTRLEIEVRDKWKLLENYRFSDPIPLDGSNFADAVTYILTTAGMNAANIEVEDTGFKLPIADGQSKGDWACQIEAGDTAADWLNRLHENYCATWFIGFVPQGGVSKFRLVSPERLGSTSVYTLYDNVAAAYANEDEATGANIINYVYREYSDHTLEPEANSIWVTGRDANTGRAIQAHREDIASQDATTDPGGAPDNHLGEVRKYALIDSTIATQDALERATNILFDRLTKSRTIAEFTCELMVKEDGTPVWRGDVITLFGFGDYRIKSFSTDVTRDYDSATGWYWRPTKYVAESITDVATSVSSHGGYSLEEVKALHLLRAVSKQHVREDLASLAIKGMRPLYTYAL